MWSVWLVFCDCGFHCVYPLRDKDKRLMEAFWWERLTEGETGSYPDGLAMLCKSLIQFSLEGWHSVPSLLFDLRPNYGGVNEDNVDLQKFPCTHCCTQCPRSCSKALLDLCLHWRILDTHRKSGSVSCGVTAPFPWVLVHTSFCLCPPSVCFPSSVWV